MLPMTWFTAKQRSDPLLFTFLQVRSHFHIDIRHSALFNFFLEI